MGVLTNTPTLSYIYIKDLLITYEDIVYQVENTYTNKSYVYWYASDPYKLITSNTILNAKAGLYYIYFNQKGNYTQVPQEDIQISFSDGESKDLIAEKILGFQEQQGINNEHFATMEADINGIKTSVGEIEQDITGTKQTISEIDQKANNISLSVETLEREYQSNEELQTIRNNTNIALLNLQSTLGLFNSDMNTYMEDNKMTDEESKEINTYKQNIEKEKTELNTQIDIVINLLKSQNKTNEANQLTSQKSSLNNSINNLITNINTVCTDKVFTNTEMASIISYFSKANTEINETNNMIDDFIFLESGGKLIQKISDLVIQQDEIRLGVKEETKILNEELSSIEERVQSAETLLTKDSITDIVKDTYYTKTEMNDKLDALEDGVQGEIEKTKKTVASHTTSINDITSKIEETEETITSINGEVTAIEKRVKTAESSLTKESLTTTIGDYYLKEDDIEGAIDLKEYAKKSDVQQTVDSWSVKFSESGGYNLIKNSTGANGSINGWTHTGTNLGTSVNESISPNGRYFMFFDNGNTITEKFAYSSRFKLRPNTVYRFTGYFHNYTNCSSFDVYILASTSVNESDKTTSYDEAIQLINKQNTNGAWKKYTFTFTTPANVKSGFIRIDNNGYNSAGSGGNRVHWHCLILTAGELEVPWSPHPCEVYDGITTIDKNGVKVSQSNYNGYTQMKADGFYVNNGVEDVIKVTSSGAEFKGKVTIRSGSTVPTSTLDGTISNTQLNSSILNDISNANKNATNAMDTANTANSTANSVKDTVDNNKTNWNNAYNRVAEWAYGAITGSVTIDGGLIQADTILAKHIAANAITANKIAANAITAAKISAGAITADKIDTKAIESKHIAANAITANMITSGTMSADRISGGTIKGVTLQTYADSTTSGVVIQKEAMSLNGTKFLYESYDNFRIASDQTITLSSPSDIYLMPGLISNSSQTGTNSVIIPNAILRVQKLTVVNNASIQGACAVSGQISCSGLTSIASITAKNGFNSDNGGVYVSGSITTTGGNISATNGTITGKNLRAANDMSCTDLGVSGNMSVSNNAWIKYLYVNGTWVASDKRLKTDIKYVDKDVQEIGESGLIAPNVNINKNDMLEFVESLPIASYRYKDDVENEKDITHYGLVVQDVLYTKVGSELVKVLDEEKQIGDEGDYMGYSQEKLLVFMCGALQKEIELRKALEQRVEELENKK